MPRYTLHLEFEAPDDDIARLLAWPKALMLGVPHEDYHLTPAHDWSIHIKEQP